MTGLLSGNDTERVRDVTNGTAPITHYPRALPGVILSGAKDLSHVILSVSEESGRKDSSSLCSSE